MTFRELQKIAQDFGYSIHKNVYSYLHRKKFKYCVAPQIHGSVSYHNDLESIEKRLHWVRIVRGWQEEV